MPSSCPTLVLWGGIESPLGPTEALSQNQPGRAVADVARCARGSPLAAHDLGEAVVHNDAASSTLAFETVAVATHGKHKTGTQLGSSESSDYQNLKHLQN